MKELEDTEKPSKSFKVQLRFQLKKYWKYSRKWFPFSIVIGLISGVLMGLFIASIVQLWDLVDKINYYYALFPIVGGITSLLLYFGFKEVKGAGISYVLTHKNTTTPIPSRTIFTKFFASLLTLGVNAPAGREGPAVTIGSSVAYSLGDKLKMTKEDQGHAITIGAAACTAAVFRAPLGGTVFASEVPYKHDLDETVFLPALVASAISLLVSQAILTFLNSHPTYLEVDVISSSLTFVDASLFVLLGVFAGIFGILFSLLYKLLSRNIEKILKPFLLPFVGMIITALLVFVIELALPEGISLGGTGFFSINHLMENYASIGLRVLFILFLGKIVVTSTCVGLGASGGVMGPSLVTGAAMGALYSRLFPSLNPLVVIVIGMSAMHAATTKTPIASMILVLEMVGFPNLIIPMILSNAAAFIISMDFSLYTGQIESKEVILRRRIQYTDILSSLKVREAMETDFPTVKENEKLTDCFALLYLHKKSALVVLDDNKELIGIISAIDFQQGFAKGHKYVRNVMSKDVIVAYPDDTLSSAFDKLTDNRIECMPVVDIDNPTKMLGFVTFRDIENRYETAMTKLHSQRSLTIEELIDNDI